ncbi:hypothetical protein CCACVL1_26601 [Corchorus capsularis]|uniref:Kinesin-like protein KIN-8B n=1 Tax=Corchorus capsularis TaxID=210143 RepID=A0A1R3GE70_COCAP|nr:hypothetical protein CCACVL1_26601 [Corchorus capsularis]
MPMIRAPAKKKTTTLTVAVKCRPLAEREHGGDIVRVKNNKEVVVLDPDLTKDYLDRIQNRTKEKKYCFDHAFDPHWTNLDAYQKCISTVISGVVQGLNATVFAYGSTGSGKTYTMVGTKHDPGLMVLSLHTIFDLIQRDKSSDEFEVTCSYLEVYNEVIYDLLEKSSGPLELREDPEQGIIVAGLRCIKVHSADKILELLNLGNSRRKTESTEANATSSRSHAVLEITVRRKQKNKYRNQVMRGKLALVDLAGSERASETNSGGQKLRDGANINRSLLALANCINALGKQQKKGLAYVPYRNSKLTRILKDGLSGNSQTVMVATISPAGSQYHHTVNTLKYADRAKEIKTHIQKNIGTIDTHVSDYQRMIDSLQVEVCRLKKELAEKDSQLSVKPVEKAADDELSWLNILSQEISENVQERINLQKALFELEETNLRNRTELQHLDDAIAKHQATEKDGAVVEVLRVRRQDILDNIRDNDEAGVNYQKEIEANEKQRCQLQHMIDEAISNNGNKTYLRILSQYRLLGMANTELQFEMAMRDQIIHNQREAQRNLWNLLMGLGLDEKQILELAAKQGITIEDWTMTRYLGLSNKEQSPNLALGGYPPLSYGLSISQWHSRSSCIYPNYQNVASNPFSRGSWDSSPTICREEHHSSYYLVAHNSPPFVKFRSSDNWVGGHPVSQFGSPEKLPRDLRKSYPEMNSPVSSCNESYLLSPALSADYGQRQKDTMRQNEYSKGPHVGMSGNQDSFKRSRGGNQNQRMRKRAAPSVLDKKLLRDRVRSCQQAYSAADEIVDHLRAEYSAYSRLRWQPFAMAVQGALQQLQSSSANTKKNILHFSEDDEEHAVTPSSSYSHSAKKPRKTDENEEKLQRLEDLHIQKRQVKRQSDSDSESDSDSDSSSSSSSGSSSDEGEKEDGTTSGDAIYGQEEEPKYDLIKSILRQRYTKSNDRKSKLEEKNIEVEVATGKAKNKIDMSNGGGTGNREGGGLKKAIKNSASDAAEGVEVKGKEGPRFKDLGGMGGVLEELKMEVIVPLYHPHLPRWLGVRPMAGILLHGPPGCGKTKLAHAIANETGVPFYQISATEVVSGVSGASEENIRELFSKAYRTAPSIVFIDEIDAIASKRENLQREMERRIVTQLMTCMDESHRLVQPNDKESSSEGSDSKPGYVLVIGATNRPDAVDSALRRPGRFDREIVLGIPDENARHEILSVLTRNLRLEGTFDLFKIARSTPGFVGADLAALANKAGNLAMKRIIDQRKHEFSRESMDEKQADEWWRQPWLPEEMEKLTITMADFEEAAKMVQPSSRREGFSTIPNVKWEDVGGLDFLRQEFERYIVRRIKFPEDYAGPELLNKYVGESELAVRTLFTRARTCSPCILFFDEVDALTTGRGKEGGWVVERLLNQLLIELDGADQRRGVYVIGATNRPDVMDRAVLRPGRFGKLLYVSLPSADERGLILNALARKKPIDASVDLNAIAHMKACENLSGADLSALMNEAAMGALEEKLSSAEISEIPWTIKTSHFERALSKIKPSVSDKERQKYENLSKDFKTA